MKLTRVNCERILFGNVWVFGPAESEESWGKMVFLSYGRIFGYDNANEYGWDFKSSALRLTRKDGEPTSIYESYTMVSGRPRMLGRSILSPGSIFRLERLDPEQW